MAESNFFEITDYCLNNKNISLILKEHIFKNHEEICDKYNSSNKQHNPSNKQHNPSNNPSNKQQNSTNNDFFIKEKDKLFWMLYIFENGYDNYNMLGKNTYSLEMKEKTKLVKQVKERKKELKSFKIKIHDIEADLLYSKKINITTLFTLLTIKHINFLYYTENIVYQWKKEENDKFFIIKHNTLDNIFTNEDKALTDEYFELLKESRLLVDNLKKPIMGVSYYKVGELKDICEKFKINIMKNAKKTFSKKELYEKILQKVGIKYEI